MINFSLKPYKNYNKKSTDKKIINHVIRNLIRNIRQKIYMDLKNIDVKSKKKKYPDIINEKNISVSNLCFLQYDTIKFSFVSNRPHYKIKSYNILYDTTKVQLFCWYTKFILHGIICKYDDFEKIISYMFNELKKKCNNATDHISINMYHKSVFGINITITITLDRNFLYLSFKTYLNKISNMERTDFLNSGLLI